MTRKEIEALLVSWGWISLGDCVLSNGDYTINIEAFPVKRGFMINHADNVTRLWVTEDDINKDLAIHFFLKHVRDVYGNDNVSVSANSSALLSGFVSRG